jgi:signal transduction histidine kinase
MSPTNSEPDKSLGGVPTVAGLIQRRLTAGLVVLSLAAGSVVGLGLYAYFQTDRAYSNVVSEAVVLQTLLAALDDAATAEALHTRAFLAAGDELSYASRELAHEDFQRTYAGLQARQPGLPPAAAAALQELNSQHEIFEAIADEAIGLKRAGRDAQAELLFNRGTDPVMLRIMEQRRELQTSLQDVLAAASQAHSRRSAFIIVIVALSFGLVVPVASLLIARLLMPTVAALNYVEQALAATVESRGYRHTSLPTGLTLEQVGLVKAYAALVERLSANEASRFELISRLTHDLRAPLASSSGYAALMADPDFTASPEEIRKYAGIITRQAERMEHMLEQMLTASLIEENRLAMAPAPMRLAGLLEAVIKEKRRQSGREISLADYLPGAVVLADGLRLGQVFGHILDNAVKFSPRGAPVEAAISPAARPGWMDVFISDRGVGIEAADMPRLFQRFSRIYNRAARGANGSGLGLYISRHIVEGHGGSIELESQPGDGTTVRISLPLEAQAAGARSNEEEGRWLNTHTPAQSPSA